MADLKRGQCVQCGTFIRYRKAAATSLCAPCYTLSRQSKGVVPTVPLPFVPPPVLPPPRVTPADRVETDRTQRRDQSELLLLRQKYEASLRTIERQEADLRTMNVLSTQLDTYAITLKPGNRQTEGTVVMVASDWHMEEQVGLEMGGLNTFTLDIAKARATRFFQSGLRLLQLLQQDVTINTVVLALLGDFITNQIHGAENAEKNAALPNDALLMAQAALISGIQFLLDHSSVNLIIPCHSGNHARTTLKTRFASENGHSLEYLMYVLLATHFRQEPRIQFLIPEGMHSYLTVYDTTIRFHHGHAVKYGGGVGGIYIPVNKAIAQWNKARHADLDVFGHFHQMRDGGNFLCNGSLIGYNAFALSIKADYEKPRQLLFLIDAKHGRTCTWPILLG